MVLSQSTSSSSKQVGLSTPLQEIEMNKMEEKEMSPISKSLEIFGPRHAKGVVVAQREGKHHHMWNKNDSNHVHLRTIEMKAAHLGIFLNVMSAQNAELASCVLHNLLERRGMEQVKCGVQKPSGTDSKLDAALVNNIKCFLEFHKNEKGGTLKLDEQIAVQAVKQAISFFDIGSQATVNISNRRIANRLGYCGDSGHTNNDFTEFQERS
jgi:hypothetical protein